MQVLVYVGNVGALGWLEQAFKYIESCILKWPLLANREVLREKS